MNEKSRIYRPDPVPSDGPGPGEAAASTPKHTTDLPSSILGILTDGNVKWPAKNAQIARRVVQALCAMGKFYYHAELRTFSTAMFFDESRHRLECVQSDSFRAWLGELAGVNRAGSVFKAITAEVESAALNDTHSHGLLPEAYWAQRENQIYVSCGDGEVCRITPGKFEMVSNGTDEVLFAAGKTLLPWHLTHPQDPFESCRLFGKIQDNAANATELVRLWTLSLPTSPQNKPPLCFYGHNRSGKTRMAKGIAEFYGLPVRIAKVEERGERDFWTAMNSGGLFTLDNADTKTKWLADAVSAAATGGCNTQRRLYTNTDNVVLDARSWLAITTANPTFAEDTALADRLLVVRLKPREGVTEDEELTKEIRDNRDAGLSFVVRTLAEALKDDKPIPPGLNQRHPDFATFAVKIGRALGREKESIEALSMAETDKARFCLENDLLGAALLAEIAANKEVIGSASDIQNQVARHEPELKSWATRKVGKRLSALWLHITSMFNAGKELDRTGVNVFTITQK